MFADLNGQSHRFWFSLSRASHRFCLIFSEWGICYINNYIQLVNIEVGHMSHWQKKIVSWVKSNLWGENRETWSWSWSSGRRSADSRKKNTKTKKSKHPRTTYFNHYHILDINDRILTKIIHKNCGNTFEGGFFLAVGNEDGQVLIQHWSRLAKSPLGRNRRKRNRSLGHTRQKPVHSEEVGPHAN